MLAPVTGFPRVRGVLASGPEATGVAPVAEPQPAFPAGGAGLFDVDPDQRDVSQDPTIAVDGDVESLPEDMEF